MKAMGIGTGVALEKVGTLRGAEARLGQHNSTKKEVVPEGRLCRVSDG